MFQEREVPWHMDKKNGAELEEFNEEESYNSYIESVETHGFGFAPNWQDVKVREGE